MPPRRRPPLWAFVSAAWLGPAILAAFQAYVQGRLGSREPATWRSLLWEGGDWLRERVAEARRWRDAGAVAPALEALGAAAREAGAPLMPRIVDAVRARATLGEISDVLRDVWGVYRPG